MTILYGRIDLRNETLGHIISLGLGDCIGEENLMMMGPLDVISKVDSLLIEEDSALMVVDKETWLVMRKVLWG